jgi:hypothetical protein
MDNTLSIENLVHNTVTLKSYSNLGKRHSIDVGRILLNKDRSLTKQNSKQQKVDNSESNILNSLASATSELKKSIEILTQKTHLSKPTELDPYRRKSFCTATGRVNDNCSLEKSSFSNNGQKSTPSLGGRHSEERWRSRNNHSRRLSSFLSKCEEELPTSTLLEIKRLRGELLQNSDEQI